MNKRYVLGLDMGGTNSVIGLVDEQGNVVVRNSIRTQDYPDENDYIEALYQSAKEMIAPICTMDEIGGIGAGAPNANYYTGRIEGAMNLPWHDMNLAELLSRKFGMVCKVTNDANAAAQGEMVYGAAKDWKHFIMITLGTGVGSGIVVDGKVLYGHDGFAGELGHTCVDRSEHARLCNCGKKGCLEAYCSATGVARTAKEILLSSDRETLLRQLDINQITSKEVYEAAEQGDEVAKQIFDTTGEILGWSLADFVHFSAPEAIVLFGGLTRAGHWIMDPIVRSMNEHLMSIWRQKVKVVLSSLKEADAALLGAAALVK